MKRGLFHRKRRVSDLDRVEDTVYLVGGQTPGYLYLTCGFCGRETEPVEEVTLAEGIAWARTHHLALS